jgi:hypothetical protein
MTDDLEGDARHVRGDLMGGPPVAGIYRLRSRLVNGRQERVCLAAPLDIAALPAGYQPP